MFALPGRQAKWMSRNSRRRRLVKEFEINFNSETSQIWKIYATGNTASDV